MYAVHTITQEHPHCHLAVYKSYMPPCYGVVPVRPGRTPPARSNPLRYMLHPQGEVEPAPHPPRLRPQGIPDVAIEDEDAKMHQRSLTEYGFVSPLKPAKPEKTSE